jgi:hypothetical protein
MDEKINLEFLKNTICKVRDEVAKIMKETNYGILFLNFKKMIT